ncbi:hypothetical protein [Agrobacterium tumefaciens]|uniref:hypothetical protein n=1 Tax=Agrobacterium tumefaciens TaxID=358 RepID=UPI002AFEE099|nr:hypothetical protein [Agrobacterium tumefaciens]MEA1842970.1 hypothetical protein [Agrobacterium tumefaciens]
MSISQSGMTGNNTTQRERFADNGLVVAKDWGFVNQDIAKLPQLGAAEIIKQAHDRYAVEPLVGQMSNLSIRTHAELNYSWCIIFYSI